MAGRFRLPRAFRTLTLGLALGAWSAWPTTSAGQGRTGVISGRLVDRESRNPIRGAHIALLGSRRGFASDSEGRFAQDSLDPGNYLVQVRAIGYVRASWVVQLRMGEVHAEVFELERLAVQLEPVTVERRPGFAAERMREFERRRASGRGHFITADQIEHAKPRALSDLLRNVPGVRLVCRGSASCTIRMSRAARDCRPDFVLDGFPATNSTSLDMPTVGIIGIEVYRTLSETPLEFLKTDNICGTIVLWTRSGPTATGSASGSCCRRWHS